MLKGASAEWGWAPRPGSLGLSFPHGLALGKVLDSSGPQFPYTENQGVGRKWLCSLLDVKFKCVLQTPPSSNSSVLFCTILSGGQDRPSSWSVQNRVTVSIIK